MGQPAVIKLAKLDSTINATYLAKIFPLDDFCIFPDSEEDFVRSFIQMHSQNFTFYSINTEDTIAIFSGKLCGGHESGIITEYKFVDGEPQKVFTRPGKVTRVEDDEISTYTYPCCAEIINIITRFNIVSGKQTGQPFVFYNRDDWSVINDSASSDSLMRFSAKEDCSVHYSSSESETPMIPMCNDNYSNIIGKISKGQEGNVISQSKNGWVLVRLDLMETTSGYCFNEYYKKLIQTDNYILVGWIKTDYIKIH